MVFIVLVIFFVLTGDRSSSSNFRESSSKKMNESRSTEGLSVARMSNLSMTSDSVLFFGVLACVLERLSIHSIRTSESAKRL